MAKQWNAFQEISSRTGNPGSKELALDAFGEIMSKESLQYLHYMIG